MKIVSVPVDTNPKLRESRLFKSTPEHVLKSAVDIIRAYIMYKPYIIFGVASLIFFVLGALPFARYVYLTVTEDRGSGHLQSLILVSVLLIASLLCLALNVIADLIRINRILTEYNLEHTKKMRFGTSHQR